MGGAAPTKSLMQNYCSAGKPELGWGSLPVLHAEDSHSGSRAHLTLFPQPDRQQQSEQHGKPKRNARCSGLTIGAEGDVLRTEGSYTANLRAGMPARTTNGAIRWMLGNAGSWSIPAGATAGARPPAPHMLRSPLRLPRGRMQCPQPCLTHGTTQGRLHGYGLELVPPPSCRSHPGQQRGTGLVPAPQLPGKSIATHPSPPPCSRPTSPVLWPRLSSCLVPALNRSFILRVRKETAHCQISYLRGNLSSFIELPVTGPGLLRAVPVTSMRC